MEGEQEAARSLRRALQGPHRKRRAPRSLPAVSHLPQRAARQRHRDQPAPGGERLPDGSRVLWRGHAAGRAGIRHFPHPGDPDQRGCGFLQPGGDLWDSNGSLCGGGSPGGENVAGVARLANFQQRWKFSVQEQVPAREYPSLRQPVARCPVGVVHRRADDFCRSGKPPAEPSGNSATRTCSHDAGSPGAAGVLKPCPGPTGNARPHPTGTIPFTGRPMECRTASSPIMSLSGGPFCPAPAWSIWRSRQRPCPALKDVLICRPGVAREQLRVEVRWGNSSFTIHERRNLLCIGRLEERESAPKANVLMFDVAARGEPVEPRALYAELDRLGYRYGPGLQVIRSVLKLADGMLFNLSAGNHRDCRSETMNPALLDGAIQAVLCLLQYSDKPIRPGGLLVPTGIRRLSIHGSVRGTCFVQVGESALTRRADDVLADLQIRNERGRPLLRIEGLLLKYVPRDFSSKPSIRSSGRP